jgi:rhodanese-related sulfurtransferase
MGKGRDMDEIKVTPDKAKALLDQGQAVFLDARSPEDWGRSRVQLPGSLRLTPEQVMPRAPQWPRGSSVIAYCT